MSLRIPTPTGLDPAFALALDEIIAPLQVWADKETGGRGWVSLSQSDLGGIRGDSGVTFTTTAAFGTNTVAGFLKYIRFGRFITVAFNIWLTPSAVTGQIDFILPQFGVVDRMHNTAYDSNGNALSVTIGTPLRVLGITTIPETTSILHFEKLSGADFAASSQGLIGQVTAELSELNQVTV